MSRARAKTPSPVSRQVRRAEARKPADQPRVQPAAVAPLNPALMRQARLAAMVIAAAALPWVGGQWLGAELGWPARYVFLFDLAALGAFVWALVVTWRIWRRRHEE